MFLGAARRSGRRPPHTPVGAAPALASARPGRYLNVGGEYPTHWRGGGSREEWTTGTGCRADCEAIGGSGPGAGRARVVTNRHGLRRNDPLPRRRQRVPRQGWAMRRGRPHPQEGENLLDHRGLLDEGDDPHGARTAWADEGIDLVNLLDQPCPGALARKVRSPFGLFLPTRRRGHVGRRNREPCSMTSVDWVSPLQGSQEVGGCRERPGAVPRAAGWLPRWGAPTRPRRRTGNL